MYAVIDRVDIACTALLLSLVLGWLFSRLLGLHMLSRGVHRITAKIFHRMNRHERADTTRAMRGLVIVGVYCLLAMILGDIAHLGLAAVLPYGHGEMVLLAGLLRASNVWLPLLAMAHAAKKNLWSKLDTHLRTLAPGCHADDGHGKLRLGILLSIRHLQHGVVGSLLAYLIMGIAGLLLYRAVIVCAAHAPQHLVQWRALGLGTCWVARPLGAISALVTSLIGIMGGFIAGALLPRLHPRAATRHISTNLHPFVAAMLAISLGGKYRMFGHGYTDDWQGNGTAQLRAEHALAASVWLGCVAAVWLGVLFITRIFI